MTPITEGIGRPEVPHTFADIYEDEKLLEQTLKATEVFKRCIDNILFSYVDNATKRDLIVQCVQEFFEEIDRTS